MAVKQVVLKLDDRIKRDFFDRVPDVSAFLRRCVIEATYGQDPTKWPFYVTSPQRGRPQRVDRTTYKVPKLIREIVNENLVEVMSSLGNPSEELIGEDTLLIAKDSEPKKTLDELIHELKQEVENDDQVGKEGKG